MSIDYKLTSNDSLTKLAKRHGIETWNNLIKYVKNIPYGRTSDRANLSLVILENTGTCSSKHAYLKQVADFNHIPNVKLILSVFKMNPLNTPKIGDAITGCSIDYIPEAHCYLKILDECIDVTSKHLDFAKIKADIIEELEIKAEQVITFKDDYHKKFIKNWIVKDSLPLNFDEIWKLRETCIKNLSK
ncbi:hypothetical protein [Yeosuana marina]|uniref:hypothetical protein n=1 Tax=Yeosuana marina TaxID=1565536 RepID=UPI0030ECD880|tara:strand:+ start:4868 stop:5431 length:564 start_codon:yes stop_codon:yes gene_type:complete